MSTVERVERTLALPILPPARTLQSFVRSYCLFPPRPHENLFYRAIEYPSQKFHAQRPSGR